MDKLLKFCCIFTLQAIPGWPKVEEVLLLVKFSYTVALTQGLLACSRLQSADDVLNLEREWSDVVQYSCLPFLRRAALLVFLYPILITSFLIEIFHNHLELTKYHCFPDKF